MISHLSTFKFFFVKSIKITPVSLFILILFLKLMDHVRPRHSKQVHQSLLKTTFTQIEKQCAVLSILKLLEISKFIVNIVLRMTNSYKKVSQKTIYDFFNIPYFRFFFFIQNFTSKFLKMFSKINGIGKAKIELIRFHG